MRCSWSMAVGALLGCSFVDDFDKFQARGTLPDGDGGAPMDASGQDADAARDATSTAVDGELARDSELANDGELAPVDCSAAGVVDGTRCGDGLICRFQVCRPSVCGDGIVDALRGELCDEVNEIRGDGCEPVSCIYSCDEDGDCDDARQCNGRERCDQTAHRCLPGAPASVQGESCTTSANARGSCGMGLCVPELCGNGRLDPGEACEPAMAACRPDCQPGCRSDADCRNSDACDGLESCDMSSHDCRPGVRLDCVDADACTLDGVCDPNSGCLFRLIDEDLDGFSPPACAASSGRAADCNDANANVWPGASERCDGIDNDCDGQVDEGVLAQCFADNDGDGYPAREEVRRACACPPRTIAVPSPATYEAWDCWDDPRDRGADVHPGQASFFAEGYGPGGRGERSFDYDCDGRPAPRYGAIDAQGCTGLLGLVCDMKQGFARVAPPCGESGAYVVCASGALACEARENSRKQECH